MLNGELTPRSNLIGELTGGVFYGTNDYEELINKPSINGVELVGNKTTSDLGIDIPTELSELTNDVGFITSADVPTATSQLTNDSGFITTSDIAPVAVSGDYDDLTNKPTIPTLTSQLTNDSGFITNASVPTMTSQLFNDSGYITSADIPTDVSAFTNDAGYITSADIPTDVSAFNNDAGYLTSSDVAEVAISGDYDDLINKPTIPDNLSDLNDTTITTPSNADLLAYDSSTSKWVNTDLKGQASGSIATFTNGGNGIPVSEFECEIGATGFSQADIVVCGVNLWDEDWEVGGINWTTGENSGEIDRLRSKNYIPIKENTGYYFKAPNNIVRYVWFYDANKTLIENVSGSNNYIQINAGVYNFTSPIGACYCRFILWTTYGTTYNNDVSINYPSTDTQYHTYTGNLYTVSFGASFNSGNLIYKNGEWFIDDNGTITPITSSTRVKTISGNNNIYSNTGDCELKYFTNKSDSLAELIKAFVL